MISWLKKKHAIEEKTKIIAPELYRTHLYITLIDGRSDHYWTTDPFPDKNRKFSEQPDFKRFYL